MGAAERKRRRSSKPAAKPESGETHLTREQRAQLRDLADAAESEAYVAKRIRELALEHGWDVDHVAELVAGKKPKP